MRPRINYSGRLRYLLSGKADRRLHPRSDVRKAPISGVAPQPHQTRNLPLRKSTTDCASLAWDHHTVTPTANGAFGRSSWKRGNTFHKSELGRSAFFLESPRPDTTRRLEKRSLDHKHLPRHRHHHRHLHSLSPSTFPGPSLSSLHSTCRYPAGTICTRSCLKTTELLNTQYGLAKTNYQGDGEINGGAVSQQVLPCRDSRLTSLCRSVPGISAVPHEDNLRYFDVMIHGPTQSPYEGEIRPRKPQIPHSLTSTQAVSSSWSYSSRMITL
jgi:hypothetical protein